MDCVLQIKPITSLAFHGHWKYVMYQKRCKGEKKGGGNLLTILLVYQE